MPHFRVDDALHSHPKAQRAGDEAMGMWARAGSFCMAYLTNGFVPDWWVKQQSKGPQKARRLVAAGLWHGGAEQDGERGYMFHEFVGPGRQDSREQIEADRQKWRKKKQRQREVSHEVSTDPSPIVSPAMSPGDTSGESPGESWVLPNTNTNPLVVTSGGEVTKADARDGNSPPPETCPKHRDNPNPPDCGACAGYRRRRAAWDEQHTTALANARAAFWAGVRACPDCDERGNVDLGNAVSKCTKHDWEGIRDA